VSTNYITALDTFTADQNVVTNKRNGLQCKQLHNSAMSKYTTTSTKTWLLEIGIPFCDTMLKTLLH